MIELISRFSVPGLALVVLGLVAFAVIKLRSDDARRAPVCRICGAPVDRKNADGVPTCPDGHINPDATSIH